jgi:hypothetical protein
MKVCIFETERSLSLENEIGLQINMYADGNIYWTMEIQKSFFCGDINHCGGSTIV